MIENDQSLLERLKKIKLLSKRLPLLTNGQFLYVEKIVKTFALETTFKLVNSDLFTIEMVNNFGDALLIHHCVSREAFTKDKFEYLLESILKQGGIDAKLAPKGNPGFDIEINGVKTSLKTQADKSIKRNNIWISKFMELGRPKWTNKEEELKGLLEAFLKHLTHYERIFTLRCLSKIPYHYELVEIPKKLFNKASKGKLEMRKDTEQFPVPGYCFVTNKKGVRLYQLYFDGGGERKLQVQHLLKSECRVHATWQFSVD